ncbi:MAG: phosphoribosylglycinamide synthetase C domain-containing protein, partial [Candidatus Curtissbacteria bacterium]
GVFLPANLGGATRALKRIMIDREFGTSGIVIQERISGREVSQLAFSDGKTIVPLLPAQDHKRVNDGDRGSNTGGMGAFCPAPLSLKLQNEIFEKVLVPTIKGMAKEGNVYKGILYAGLMITESGPKVLEYNARFGDPETQPLMMLLASDLFNIMKSCTNQTLKKSLVTFRGGSALCVVLASSGYPAKYEIGKVISGLDAGDDDLQTFHAGTKASGGNILTDGGRVLGVTAYGKTMADARKKAYSRIGKDGGHFAGMHFRHDIGKS